jgi:predicted aspartyl protease
MNPYLDIEGNPHIKVNIYLSSWIAIDCYIDTGFAGGILIPERYQINFSVKIPNSFQRFQLADGSIKSYPIYRVKVKYKKKEKIVPLLFSSGKEGLVGIEFLLGFKLILDLKKFRIELD